LELKNVFHWNWMNSTTTLSVRVHISIKNKLLTLPAGLFTQFPLHLKVLNHLTLEDFRFQWDSQERNVLSNSVGCFLVASGVGISQPTHHLYICTNYLFSLQIPFFILQKIVFIILRKSEDITAKKNNKIWCPSLWS
jgi:hypothetical protein